MGRRFERIPKVGSSQQTPSLEYLKKQTTEDTQILLQARQAFDLADKQQQVALSRIQKVCKEHSNSGLLFLTQADILEKCYLKATSLVKKKKYLEEAKRSIRKAYELSNNNMLFSSYLGYLMSEGTTDAEGYNQAIDQLNEAYLISDPIDPLVSEILYDVEVERFMELYPTYEKRIENARKSIVDYLVFCVLRLKELHISVSTIKEKLQELGLKKEDKVKLYLHSLSFEERQRFVQVKNLSSYLISSKKHLANQVLSQALSYYESYGKWDFFLCCSCNKTLPNPSMHLSHTTTTHFKELSELKTVFPLSVNRSDWMLILKSMTWNPVNTSIVTPMLEQKWKLLSCARNKSSSIGNNKVGNKNHSTSESSSNADEVQSLEKETNVQETPIECFTFELLSYNVNSWAKTDVFKWNWPFVNDAKRRNLLSSIRETVEQLLSERIFLPAHMNILIQRSMSKLDGPLVVLLRNLGLEQTHYPLCLLKATQLQEILNLLQEMSDFTKKIFEQQSFTEKTLAWSTRAFEINGEISLSRESLYLSLKESISENSSVEDDTLEFHIPPAVEDLVTWIYSDHSSDESLKIWKNLRDEKRCRGKEKLVTYKDNLRKVADCQKGLSVNVIPNDVSDLEVGKDMDFASQKPQVDSSIEATIEKESVNNDPELTEIDCQKGLSVNVIATDVSDLEVGKAMDFASQNPQVDSSIEATIEKESVNNDSELTEIDKLTLQFAMHMNQLEMLLNRFGAYDYQPIVLSIVKTYFRDYAEGIVDTTKESDGAAADQIVPDCGTVDAIKLRNPKALLESQDCGTVEEDAIKMQNRIALLESQDCGTVEEDAIKMQNLIALLESQADQSVPEDTDAEKLERLKDLMKSIGITIPDIDSKDNAPEPKVP